MGEVLKDTEGEEVMIKWREEFTDKHWWRLIIMQSMSLKVREWVDQLPQDSSCEYFLSLKKRKFIKLIYELHPQMTWEQLKTIAYEE